MAEVRYHVTIRLEGGSLSALSGTAELSEGVLRLRHELPRGHLLSVAAELPVALEEGERIFLNGFQTWTHCPEYTGSSRIRSLRRLPRWGVKVFGLDRYGDNYFVPYPDRPGITHGVSWCYFRRGDRFRLLASLDERPGYTLFQYDANLGLLTIQRDCRGLRCGGDFPLLDLFFAQGGEDEVFDAWFAAMGVAPRSREKLAGYSSWYNRYQKIDQTGILSDLEGCAALMQPGDLFQIDDGWEPFVGDWLAPDGEKFPDGMGSAAEAIHRKGFRAGLWLAPFAAQKGSALLREHPDWLLLHEGRPWYCGCNWGGFYSLDIDHPEVQDYLRQTFRRILEEWAFDLVKLDFLYAAAPFGTETESRAGRMIRAMELLRELCGDKLMLACGVPVMPAFGLADYCRVSCDVGLDWDGSWLMQQTHRERVSTRQAIQNSLFRRQLDGRAYGSDPDVFFLREENCRLTPEQKEALSTVCSLFGSVLLTSDDVSRYGPEARARYRQLLKNREAVNVRVEADEGLAVVYELDGETHRCVIETAVKGGKAK